MKAKKITASILAAALVFTGVFAGGAGWTSDYAGNYAYAEESEIPQPITENITYYMDSETGHIYSVNEDAEEESEETETAEGQSISRSSLPSSYNVYETVISKYPELRNQNPYGTCWAFAATALAEIDMIHDGDASKASTDFSELQLAYLTYHTANDRLGNLDGDKIYLSDGAENYLDVGGTGYVAMQTLSQWKGFTSEYIIPYSEAAATLESGLSTTFAVYNNCARLENARMLNINTNPDSVKEAIMENGAVSIAYRHDSSYYSLNGYALYYNPNTNVRTNHEVVIVGWDDNIPASAFPETCRPSSNGAWLVRNSWTTGTGGSEYGYFWMSYEEGTLRDTAYSMDFGSSSTYDHIYQHDGSITNSYINAESVANVFTAENPNGNSTVKSETLDAVMLTFSCDENVNYKIEIYTGLRNSKPTSGYLNSSATTTGWTQEKGVYTIKLNNPVVLAPGEKYAVVVKALNGTTAFDLETSQSTTYTQDGYTYPWYTTEASIDSGESFMVYNGTWTDITSFNWTGYGNLRIKALTSDSSVQTYDITYKMNSGTNSSKNPEYYASNSSTITLKTPTRDGYHFLGWYTDSSYTNKITKISGSTGKDLTLYAKWGKHSWITTSTTKATQSSNGSRTYKCSICDKTKTTTIYKVSTVKLKSEKLTYTGKKRTPTVIVKDSQGNTLTKGTDYTLSYGSSTRKNLGKYSVTVTFKGKYKGSKKLYFRIVPKTPANAKAQLYEKYNRIKYTWDKVSNADGYFLYYKSSTETEWTYWCATTGTSAILNVPAGTKYSLRIYSYDAVDGIGYTCIEPAEASAYALKKLNTPTVSTSSGKVKVKWNNISGETGYQISRSTSKTGTNIVATYKTTSGTSKLVSATKGKGYYYKVRAYKVSNGKKIYGPWSNVKYYKR